MGKRNFRQENKQRGALGIFNWFKLKKVFRYTDVQQLSPNIAEGFEVSGQMMQTAIGTRDDLPIQVRMCQTVVKTNQINVRSERLKFK